MSARQLDLAYAPALALRVTYLGELGYELHIARQYALYRTRKLWEAGPRSPMPATGRSTACAWKNTTWCGARTSRRITIHMKRGWASAWRPARASSGARRAADVKARGPKQSYVVHGARGVNMFGGEIVLAGDRVLGRVTSAGYGYTVGRNILCAYVAADEPCTPSTASR
jgi:4-methylaminobutanoate oxidase (formaldehyde-forming)